MLELTLFNLVLLIIISALLVFVKKTVKSVKMQNLLLLASAIITIIFHYSTFIYLFVTGDGAYAYLLDNPNLILPIYPCNVVMWSCLILALIKSDESKIKQLLVDYSFWFGIFSTLVGMFANVDFIMNPTFADYDIVKSIVAHATLLFNVLLLSVFGRVRLDFLRNMKNIFISVLGMYFIGLYCNLLFKVLVSDERAYDINSMFIIHSPFEGLDFLTYPVIALIGLLLYFVLFTVCELFKYKKGERWFDRVYSLLKKKKD